MKTSIDWLKFRTRSDPFQILSSVTASFGTASDLVTLGDQERGRDGWTFRRSLRMAGDIVLANIDYGGESQRGWARFDMPGRGCEWVQDWRELHDGLAALDGVELRRVDLALTTFDGSITHERVLKAHKDGMFSTGGRGPKLKAVTGSDGRDGRTCYIGSRDAAKFVRCYEKGFELLAKSRFPEGLAHTVREISIDGYGVAPIEDIYRVEVELKDVDRPIPLAVLVEPDGFFAGANPFCASLLPEATERRIKGLPAAEARLALHAQIANCRQAYGGLFRAMADLGMPDSEIVGLMVADEPSRRLISAGVMTLDHV